MVNASALDVVIGLIFVYWFFSSLCSAAVEVFARRGDERAKMLRSTLATLLGDLGDRVLQHAAVSPTPKAPSGSSVSYIRPEVFAHAVLDLARREVDGAAPDVRANVDAVVGKIADPKVKELLTSLAHGAEDDLDEVRGRVARWFESAMDRASESYRRATRAWMLAAAIPITLALNVDTVHVADALWKSPALTVRISDAAAAAVAHPPASPQDPDLAKRVAEAAALSKRLELPIGWTDAERAALKATLAGGGEDPVGWALRKIVGLALSVLALQLGAPFWFDLLNRLTGARKKQEPTPAKS